MKKKTFLFALWVPLIQTIQSCTVVAEFDPPPPLETIDTQLEFYSGTLVLRRSYSVLPPGTVRVSFIVSSPNGKQLATTAHGASRSIGFAIRDGVSEELIDPQGEIVYPHDITDQGVSTGFVNRPNGYLPWVHRPGDATITILSLFHDAMAPNEVNDVGTTNFISRRGNIFGFLSPSNGPGSAVMWDMNNPAATAHALPFYLHSGETSDGRVYGSLDSSGENHGIYERGVGVTPIVAPEGFVIHRVVRIENDGSMILWIRNVASQVDSCVLMQPDRTFEILYGFPDQRCGPMNENGVMVSSERSRAQPEIYFDGRTYVMEELAPNLEPEKITGLSNIVDGEFMLFDFDGNVAVIGVEPD